LTSSGPLVVAPNDSGQRLDQFLAGRMDFLSRTRVHDLILAGGVRVNGRTKPPSYRVQARDEIAINVPPPVPSALVPEHTPIDVVYEDGDMLVLNKPAGIAVHPAPGHQEHTLVHRLLARYPELPGIGGEQRPGIVHRLDLDTSGLLMVAKTERGHTALSVQLEQRAVKKGYLALLKGEPPRSEGVIDAPIARDPGHRQRMSIVSTGRPARTRYARVAAIGGYTLALAMPETGRTHQIRVHFASIGHPVAGDSVYGGRVELIERQFLHAYLLRFLRPDGSGEIEICAPLPDDLDAVLRQLVIEQGAERDRVQPAIEQMLRLAEKQFRRWSGESPADRNGSTAASEGKA
jgi:23S rRNA pseudouridine1911/1915/1917 synthase